MCAASRWSVGTLGRVGELLWDLPPLLKGSQSSSHVPTAVAGKREPGEGHLASKLDVCLAMTDRRPVICELLWEPPGRFGGSRRSFLIYLLHFSGAGRYVSHFGTPKPRGGSTCVCGGRVVLTYGELC